MNEKINSIPGYNYSKCLLPLALGLAIYTSPAVASEQGLTNAEPHCERAYNSAIYRSDFALFYNIEVRQCQPYEPSERKNWIYVFDAQGYIKVEDFERLSKAGAFNKTIIEY